MTRGSALASTGAAVAVGMFTALAVMAATHPALPVQAIGGTVGSELPAGAVNLATALFGALLVTRRPDNVVGKAMLVTGTSFLTTPFLAAMVAILPMAQSSAALLAWFGNWLWLFGQAGIFVMLFTFPTGRTLSRRWGAALRATLAGTAVLLVVSMLSPGPLDAAPALDNPFGVPALAGAVEPLLFVFVGGIVGGVVALIVRAVRSRGEERLQLRWVAFGATLFVVILVVQIIPAVPDLGLFDLVGVVVLLSAVGVAVTKYRLYDIDRLISRTVSYITLTALLIGLYLVAVTMLTTVTAPATGDSPVAVAAATLLAAAAVQPLRRRIQGVVDRRFNRAQYDAERTVDAYRLQLRDDIDLETIAADLVGVVQSTVEPVTTQLWLRPDAESQP